MPKIKLSALVSDIKGKSQGSVFSTNSGGTYFRNNPSGGGRDSQKWQNTRSAFASLSSLWKSLSNAQQDAWRDAVSSYPTVNKFGDPRIPSGYELFMRLNSTLQSVDRPILSVPVSPETMPAVDPVSIGVPDSYLAAPQDVLYVSNFKRLGAIVGHPSFFRDWAFNAPLFISFRYVPSPGSRVSLTADQVVPFIKIATADNLRFQSGFMRLKDGRLAVYQLKTLLSDLNVPYTQVSTYVLSAADLEKSASFLFSFHAADSGNSFFQLDGVVTQYDDVLWYSGAFADPVLALAETSIPEPVFDVFDYAGYTGSLFMGAALPNSPFSFGFSDFRIIDISAPAASCSLDSECPDNFICSGGECLFTGKVLSSGSTLSAVPFASVGQAFGYYTTNYLFVSLMDSLNNGVFSYESNSPDLQFLQLICDPECSSNADCVDLGFGTGNDVECQGGVCVYVGDSNQFFDPINHAFAPFLTFSGVSFPSGDFALVLSCSGRVSAGKSPSQMSYKKLAVIPADGSNYVLVDEFLSLFGTLRGGESFYFKVHLVNCSTGQQYDTVVPVNSPYKSGVRRFKAGAETPGNVN